MTRVSSMVSSALPGTAKKPGASSRTISGVNIQAIIEIAVMKVTIKCGDAIRQPERFLFAFLLQGLGESRDERRRQRALGEQVAQQIGHAKRGEKGVVLQAGAEQAGEDLVAHQTEHAARHHGEADDAGVARDVGAGLLGGILFHVSDQRSAHR